MARVVPVSLYTREGEHLADVRVMAEGDHVEVVLWAERVFVRVDLDDPTAPEFREAYKGVAFDHGPDSQHPEG